MKHWINKLLLTVILSTSIQIIIIGRANIDIPFKMINGLIVVEAEYDDVRGNFILDTGSSDVILDNNKVVSSVVVSTLGKEEALGEIEIKNFRLGSIFYSHIHALTADLNTLETYTDLDIAGILGTNAFAPKSLDIDFIGGILVISEEDVMVHTYKKLHAVPFIMHDGVPLVEISMQGDVYLFILDTGATSHFVDKSLIDGLSLQYTDTYSRRNVSTAFSSENAATVVVLDKISVGDKTLEDVRAMAMPFDRINSQSTLQVAGLISISNLSDRVIIDLNKNMLLFE